MLVEGGRSGKSYIRDKLCLHLTLELIYALKTKKILENFVGNKIEGAHDKYYGSWEEVRCSETGPVRDKLHFIGRRRKREKGSSKTKLAE